MPAGRGERDPQRFRLSVLAALRQTAAGSALVGELTAAPDLDGWLITERLLKDLAPLDDPWWLVVDDVHELGATFAGDAATAVPERQRTQTRHARNTADMRPWLCFRKHCQRRAELAGMRADDGVLDGADRNSYSAGATFWQPGSRLLGAQDCQVTFGAARRTVRSSH